MRKYNKDKYLKILDNQIYLYEIDFSLCSNEEILAILSSNVADISFNRCKFKDINASNKIFKAPISFNRCDFDGNISFDEAEFDEKIHFEHFSFKKKASFINAKFNKAIEFRNGIFDSIADFTDSNNSLSCQGINLVEAIFKDEAIFNGRDFNNGKIMESRFEAPFWFDNCKFGTRFKTIGHIFNCKKRKEFLTCLQVLKFSLRASGFNIAASDIENYELEVRKEQKIQTIDDGKGFIPNSSNIIQDNQNLYTTENVAHILRIRPNTLAVWRSQRKGPKPTYIGRKIFYKKEDLDEYLNNAK